MPDPPAPLSVDAPFLSVEGVTVRRNRTNVLRDVHLNIHRGEFVGIVGPNGAGKSTLVQAIFGPTEMPVRYDFHRRKATDVSGCLRKNCMGFSGRSAPTTKRTSHRPRTGWLGSLEQHELVRACFGFNRCGHRRHSYGRSGRSHAHGRESALRRTTSTGCHR